MTRTSLEDPGMFDCKSELGVWISSSFTALQTDEDFVLVVNTSLEQYPDENFTCRSGNRGIIWKGLGNFSQGKGRSVMGVSVSLEAMNSQTKQQKDVESRID